MEDKCTAPIWRAQYIVYNLEKPKVRITRNYCQTLGVQLTDPLFASLAAPWIGCSVYLSLVIWPQPLIRSSPFKTAVASKAEDFATFCARQAEDRACNVCCHTFKQRQLHSACGHSGCRQPICKGCLQQWYSINRPGHVINVAALCCPFCRRQPVPWAISCAAGGISSLGNTRSAIDEAASWIYAWCRSCSTAKRLMERACGQGSPLELQHWWCEECRGHDEDVRCCPGCRVPTERTAGCSHIMCGIPGCETHWCFVCGLAVDPALIYMHMIREHKSWYEGDEFDDDDEIEDEDENEPRGHLDITIHQSSRYYTFAVGGKGTA
ncbi:hypothetical protein F5Y10DRAFT_234297 [Nemania abortiva]|nr:hypothetical protein F5Y10DRAFT_234297 [Nemania abortiva]